jgi:hypothetical protein
MLTAKKSKTLFTFSAAATATLVKLLRQEKRNAFFTNTCPCQVVCGEDSLYSIVQLCNIFIYTSKRICQVFFLRSF